MKSNPSSIFAILVITFLLPLPVCAAAPSLSISHDVAEAGFYRLKWRSPGQTVQEFVLQETAGKSFSQPIVRYRGPDQSTVMSGREDGVYRYRVRAVTANGPGEWSDVRAVTVRHHSLRRAFAFFTAGAIVFLATLALIVAGARRSRGND